MNEKPIERLKFYNGQRLEADDLKLEQEYHIRVRRWINKSLYSAGIGEGLEVLPDLGNKQQVLVGSGMALDNEGREIILLDGQAIKALGNYLFIQYREETRAENGDQCNPRGNGKGQLAWGGPSRVRAEPILGFCNDFPHESSGKVVLAQIEFNPDCTVRYVHNYPRRYIGQASNAMVRQYALEGERHIDKDNPGRIYFHIRGRQPNAVTLYLRAEKFSTLYYTELGKHNHAITVNVNSVTIPAHSHPLTLVTDATTDPPTTTSGKTALDGIHNHVINDIKANVNGALTNDPLSGEPIYASFPAVIIDPTAREASLKIWFKETIDLNDSEAHFHTIPNSTDSEPAKTLPLSGTGSSLPAGVTDFTYTARGGDSANPPDPVNNPIEPLSYVKNLQIHIGNVDVNGKWPEPGSGKKCTDEILTQLRNLQPTIWGDSTKTKDELGDGSKDHPLANNGTGAIRLDLLSNELSFPEGQYYIDLIVPSGGGRVVYNLYVE
jgi:hypothetical protein